MSEGRGGGGGLGAFILGLAVGAVAGVLFAPEAGSGTRRKLSRRLENLREVAEGKVEEVRGLLEEGDDGEDEPESARAELERRLAAARRRRKSRAGGAAEGQEGDEPAA